MNLECILLCIIPMYVWWNGKIFFLNLCFWFFLSYTKCCIRLPYIFTYMQLYTHLFKMHLSILIYSRFWSRNILKILEFRMNLLIYCIKNVYYKLIIVHIIKFCWYRFFAHISYKIPTTFIKVYAWIIRVK